MKFSLSPSRLMIVLFTAVTLALPIATIALPKQERSENENRTLATFPELTDKNGDIKWDYITVRDKPSYMDDLETYFADHLAGREVWVQTKNKMEMLIGKQEINGVYTLDGNMIQVFTEYSEKDVAASINGMNKFAANHPDLPCTIMLSPTAQEFHLSQMPSYNGYLSQKSFIEDVYEQMEGFTTVDALSFMSEYKDDYLFYRTDHHWTSLGAYYGYCSAAKALGYSPYSLNDFNIETVSSEFRGTLYSKTLDNGVTPDTIDFYHLKANAPEITMTVFDGKNNTVYDSVYVRDYLEVKDKYSSFTGNNQPIIHIDTNIDNGKKLLLVKDSYAHSLVPFLANHYEKITMVDMRYINGDLNYFIDVDEYTQALFMYNTVSFSTDINANKIQFTK